MMIIIIIMIVIVIVCVNMANTDVILKREYYRFMFVCCTFPA